MLFLLYFLPETPQDIIEPSTDSVTWGDDVVVHNSINVWKMCCLVSGFGPGTANNDQ